VCVCKNSYLLLGFFPIIIIIKHSIVVLVKCELKTSKELLEDLVEKTEITGKSKNFH